MNSGKNIFKCHFCLSLEGEQLFTKVLLYIKEFLVAAVTVHNDRFALNKDHVLHLCNIKGSWTLLVIVKD